MLRVASRLYSYTLCLNKLEVERQGITRMMFLFNFLLEGICITAFIYILVSLALSSKGTRVES